MQPKTRYEREVAEISATVTRRWNKLAKSRSPQVRRVQEKVLPGTWGWRGFNAKRKPGSPTAWCHDCGGDLVIDYHDKPKVLKCPHCGHILKQANDVNSQTGHRVRDYFDYVCLAEIHGDWQLLRYFIVRMRSWCGKGPEWAMPTEVVRRWMQPGRKTIVESIGMVGLGGFYRETPWNYSGRLSIKREGLGGYRGGTSYRIDTDILARGSRFTEGLRRDGFAGRKTCKALAIEFHEIPQVFYNPHMLTLARRGLTNLLHAFLGSDGRDIEKYWPSLKIALRHGYDIRDTRLWLDHVDLLRELHMDDRSPKYICPYNINYEHDILIRRVGKIRALKQAEKDRRDAAMYEAEYHARRAAFFGLIFTDGNVEISTIRSVAEVAEEAAAMHHCVFSNRYFEKETSLLMSAKTRDGERLETIEVGLDKFDVRQSRAKFNDTSPEHDHILRILKDHMPEIREAARKKAV